MNPAKTTPSSPHLHVGISVSLIMRRVLLALIPGILMSSYYFGTGIILNCLLAIIFALLIESLLLFLRKQNIKAALMDGTATVTAVLFALCLSPFTPWWVTLIGITFAIAVAKHLFGGVGHNPFNPAMAGYVFVLLCFPAKMAYWPTMTDIDHSILSTWQQLMLVFSGLPEDIDALSGATPLANMKLELGLMTMVSEIETGPLYGVMGGSGWEWIGMAYLIGGIGLMLNGTIRWPIPVAMISTIVLLSLVFNMFDSDIYPSTLFHVFSGGTLLCAFFIATDPSSSAATTSGKLIYAAGMGVFIYIIRTWGSYPDGVAFSVLIMNGMTPLIDFFTRPKASGEH